MHVGHRVVLPLRSLQDIWFLVIARLRCWGCAPWCTPWGECPQERLLLCTRHGEERPPEGSETNQREQLGWGTVEVKVVKMKINLKRERETRNGDVSKRRPKNADKRCWSCKWTQCLEIGNDVIPIFKVCNLLVQRYTRYTRGDINIHIHNVVMYVCSSIYLYISIY